MQWPAAANCVPEHACCCPTAALLCRQALAQPQSTSPDLAAALCGVRNVKLFVGADVVQAGLTVQHIVALAADMNMSVVMPTGQGQGLSLVGPAAPAVQLWAPATRHASIGCVPTAAWLVSGQLTDLKVQSASACWPRWPRGGTGAPLVCMLPSGLLAALHCRSLSYLPRSLCCPPPTGCPLSLLPVCRGTAPHQLPPSAPPASRSWRRCCTRWPATNTREPPSPPCRQSPSRPSMARSGWGPPLVAAALTPPPAAA